MAEREQADTPGLDPSLQQGEGSTAELTDLVRLKDETNAGMPSKLMLPCPRLPVVDESME